MARLKIPLESCVAPSRTLPRHAVELELWLWEYTDESGKRRRTRYLLTEADALTRYGPSATRVEGSLEVRRPLGNTSDFQKGAP